MDNGCGMSEELRQSVLAFQSKGYGINNVNQRIQLFYGEPYGMEFKSTIQQGTSAIIRIPWQKNSEDLVIKGQKYCLLLVEAKSHDFESQ